MQSKTKQPHHDLAPGTVACPVGLSLPWAPGRLGLPPASRLSPRPVRAEASSWTALKGHPWRR